ncbi:putative quinol monooxygenase [Sagittula salina]|uniref:Antibiotic biosynthesis monooxygenase n=1 Tax=Sagittula salina TaxID=2820268 RepID=A0A940MPB6_9RHOB|nr:antibiotic biosynthesis monooxygenase [Sagittula salina]MBP0482243.1 antibiotic biosynthesis monooxygenase [Sagittula salina]
MIELTGELICYGPEADTVRQYLPDHVALTRAESGCILFDVQPVGGGIWTVHEQFEDRATFEAHQARTQASPWGQATAGILRRYDVREVEPPPEEQPMPEHVHEPPPDPAM